MTAPTSHSRSTEAGVPPVPPDPDLLAALEEERDFLLRSLDDLDSEREAGEIDEADHQALRDDYTRRAAEVLRAIDGQRTALVDGARPPRWGRRLVATALVAALAVGAGMAVASSSGSRLPGDTLTGDIRQTVSGKLQDAAALAQQGRFTDALRLYDEVLADHPDSVEALGERGLLLVSLSDATGRTALRDEGRRSIDAALRLAPRDPRLLFYRGLAERLAGEVEAAEQSIDEALAADPPPELRAAIESFRRSVGPTDAGAG